MEPIANIVDSHVHFWDPHRLRYPWLAGLPELNRAFLPANFGGGSVGAGVTKIIVVESGCEPWQYLDEVDWVSTFAKEETRLCGMVAHAAVEKGCTVEADLKLLAMRPLVKGIRRSLQDERDPGICLRPDFITGVKHLAAFQFTFDLCIRPDQIKMVTELIRRVPEIQFVLDHCGKPLVRAGKIEPWAMELRSLAALPNVYCKISGLATEADWKEWRMEEIKPYVEIVLESFGCDRVLFGGDWPVCTLATSYERWLETIWKLASSVGALQCTKLFQTNAERIYRV